MIVKYLSLRKAKRSLSQFKRLYERKAKSLDSAAKQSIQDHLLKLREAILNQDRQEAKRISSELSLASNKLMPKTTFEKVRQHAYETIFALLVAVLIRTMWWEPYTIPTGSMRPALKEQDFLVVSKTDYGINVPLQLSHFYFDPKLVQRGSVIVFNSENMDIEDSDTNYFYLFPGKKQMVKRLIGKPGDTLYFYGGHIFGIDAEGKEIAHLEHVNQTEHIPFIRFDGKVEAPAHKGGLFSPVVYYQMNQPVAKLSFNSSGSITGEMLRPMAHYSDLWGMKHFAMARLLTKAQASQIHPNADLGGDGLLYLELTHHPSLQGGALIRDEYNRNRPELAVSTSLLPLAQEHLDTLADHMTTCRFIVNKGIAYRYGWNPQSHSVHLPRLPGVPDGTYEIQDGKVYKLPFTWLPIFGGYAKPVPANHPLYKHTPERIALFYNLGIEFLDYYLPASKMQRATPSRYGYFRDQDLFLMGAPILKKGDPILADFIKREQQKQANAPTYLPFIDNGPPTLDEIRKNGIKIPEKMYLALGDNHAMSADSRQFGFVPEDNLKGGVSFIFSPPGERFGAMAQPAKSHFTFPNLAIWTAFILAATGSSLYYRRKLQKPLKF